MNKEVLFRDMKMKKMKVKEIEKIESKRARKRK